MKWMTGAQAAEIGVSIAALACYGFESWIDGHFFKNLIAAAALANLLRALAVVLLAGGEDPPPTPAPEPRS